MYTILSTNNNVVFRLSIHGLGDGNSGLFRMAQLNPTLVSAWLLMDRTVSLKFLLPCWRLTVSFTMMVQRLTNRAKRSTSAVYAESYRSYFVTREASLDGILRSAGPFETPDGTPRFDRDRQFI